jgi:ribonuclease P protein component
MQRALRLRAKQDFSLALTKGKRWANSLLVLRARPNGLPKTRLGFVTSKRLGKAVTRNTVRRRLREVARRTPVKKGWDVVMIAQPAAASADFRQIREAAIALLQRADLLESTAAFDTP